MNLLIFGHGYCSRAFVARRGEVAATVHATTRGDDDAAPTAGVTPVLFSRADEALARADVVLVSVPPDAAGDPVLGAYEAALLASRVRRVVYLSTVGVYGDHRGAWIDEETPCAPVNARSRARLAAERAWARCAAEMGAELDVLRLAGIYGPGRNALVSLREGAARRIVKPGQVFNRVHVDDVADAIGACVARVGAGRVFNLADDDPAPPQDVVEYAARLLGVPPPPERELDATELSPMARSFYGENKRVSNARIKRELGLRLAYPTYREGLRALFAAL